MTIINDDGRSRKIPALGPNTKSEAYVKAHAFMQGSVYCWCQTKPDSVFATRDLVGGTNNDWRGTPLIVIYDHHYQSFQGRYKSEDEIHEKAVKEAGKDVGWLLKSVLQNEKRNFESRDVGMVKGYQWKK